MTWRPATTNDINRAALEELLNNRATFLGIFLKKRKFVIKHLNSAIKDTNRLSLNFEIEMNKNAKLQTEKSDEEDPDIFKQNNLVTYIPNDKGQKIEDKKTPQID